MELILGPANLSTPFSFTIPTVNTRGNEIKSVSVYSSGGLDSTALLALVISELKATNRLESVKVKTFTIVKADGSTYYASRIAKKASELFGIQIEHINNLPNGKNEFEIGRAAYEPMMRNFVEVPDSIFYIGINNMAPDDIRPFSQVLHAVYTPKIFFNAPFISLHKPQIFDLYEKLGVEELVQWTHSCTRLAVGRCDQCYSCNEKVWGFNALGKNYVDTIPPDVEDISYGGTWIKP